MCFLKSLLPSSLGPAAITTEGVNTKNVGGSPPNFVSLAVALCIVVPGATTACKIFFVGAPPTFFCDMLEGPDCSSFTLKCKCSLQDEDVAYLCTVLHLVTQLVIKDPLTGPEMSKIGFRPLILLLRHQHLQVKVQSRSSSCTSRSLLQATMRSRHADFTTSCCLQIA